MASNGNGALKKLALVEVTREYQVLVTDDEEKRLLTDAQFANLYLQQLKQGQVDANKISVVPLSLADVNAQIAIGQEDLTHFTVDGTADENAMKDIVSNDISITTSPAVRSNEERFEWTHPATRLLLQLYRTYNEKRQPEQRKKDMWNNISQEMKANGYRVDGETCDKKWRNLKTRFRAIIDKHKIEGVNRMKKKWEYFDAVNEILQRENELASQPMELPAIISEAQVPSSLLCTALLAQRAQREQQQNAEKSHADTPSTGATTEPNLVKLSVAKPQPQQIQINLLEDTTTNTGSNNTDSTRMVRKFKLNSRMALKRLRMNSLPRWLEKYIEVQRSTEFKRMQQLDAMHQETVKLLKEHNQALQKMTSLLTTVLKRKVVKSPANQKQAKSSQEMERSS